MSRQFPHESNFYLDAPLIFLGGAFTVLALRVYGRFGNPMNGSLQAVDGRANRPQLGRIVVD